MDVRRLFDAALFESQAEGALERGAGHRLGGGGSAQAVVAPGAWPPRGFTPFGREEQLDMFMSDPLLAQALESALGQGDVTITIAPGAWPPRALRPLPARMCRSMRPESMSGTDKRKPSPRRKPQE